MDQHEQDPRGHGLGGAQNGEHVFDREVEDRDHMSNAGEVEAQTRTMRDYMNPTRQTPISAIVLPAHHTTLNLRSGMLQALPHFNGCESERPYMHLKDFEDACSIFQDNSCPREVLNIKLGIEDEVNAKLTALSRQVEALAHAKAATSLTNESSSMCVLCDTMDHCTDVCPIVAGVKEARGQVNVVGQFSRNESNPYSNTYNPGWRNHPNFGWRQEGQQNMQNFSQNAQNWQSQQQPYQASHSYPTQTVAPQSQPMPYSAPQVPPPAHYQPPHWRNEDHETRTKAPNFEQSFMNFEKYMGKVNSILESLVISQQMQGRFPAQPQQNPKPANCIEETHEQVQAITTLRIGKEIDKTIAPKRVIQGEEKSKELGVESERHKLEEERKENKGQEHEHDSEPVIKVPNEITVEDLKHAPFPQRLAKDVLIQVDTVYYPVDFIVLDTQPVDVESFKRHIPVILGRPFLATANAVIHCRHGLLKLSFGNMTLETNIFTVGKQMKEVDQIEEINVIESIIQEHVDREFMEDSIERALVWSELHDQLESESVSFRDASIVGKEGESVLHVGHWTPTFEPLAPSVVKPVSSEEKPPIPERKPLAIYT
ncbi:hypothetical protein Acr_00g0032950 [Actinidia rufa]|uniref:Uncharacterized protein n=1 Tax=Actinidia rufa TaxID=165716 RepID=A0A7J0DHG6_9ERIC|nr:hypothetical protein Acr_00g0032950 [Actinidia rufa]